MQRFPEQRRPKLMPRGDGPYQIIERIDDNTYKVDLPGMVLVVHSMFLIFLYLM
jgi:hypothetical protein